MPTYQYACTECDHRFEQFQSFSDDSLTHCPVCDGRLRKVFNAVGVVFKGSGFYRTDSRDAAAKSAAGASSSDKSASAPKESSPSIESKPADKPAEKKAPAKKSESSSSSTSASRS